MEHGGGVSRGGGKLQPVLMRPWGGGGYWLEGLGGGLGFGGGLLGGDARDYYCMHDIKDRAAYPLGRAESRVHPVQPWPHNPL